MTDETQPNETDGVPDESDRKQIPGETEYLHEDPYIHGVACGLQEKYDLSDEVYSYLVYGLETPVTSNGEIAENNEESVAVLAIMPPMMPGGVPMPMEVPMLDGEDPYTIDTEASELDGMDIVAYYDEEQESTVTGMVVDVDEEDEMASLVVGSDDDQEVVSVHTDGDTTSVEINGTSMAGGFSMANDDDEHLKSWWRVDKFEEAIQEHDE
jgi:hypothetical protein